MSRSSGARRWRFVVLPDTQVYAKQEPELFAAQTRWIAEHAQRLDIRFVLHEGDVVDDNSAAQWRVARRAMGLLDGAVPYVVVPGNHDLGPGGSGSDRATGLDASFADAGIFERPSFGGSFDGSLANTWHRFDTPDGPWLVVGLEFAPRAAVVAWADAVLRAHPDRPAIVLTHAYLYPDGTRYAADALHRQRWHPRRYGVARREPIHDGESLFDGLVRKHDQIELVLCGHALDEGVAWRRSVQDGGGVVHEVLTNYQHRARGGLGYLRLFEVDAAAGRIRVRTYSPVTGSDRPAEALDLPLGG